MEKYEEAKNEEKTHTFSAMEQKKLRYGVHVIYGSARVMQNVHVDILKYE